MSEIVVIGAGIVGTTIAKQLSKSGKVLLIDAGLPDSGSLPSGGHLKQSWFAGLGRDIWEPALECLHTCYDLIEENMEIKGKDKTEKILRLDMDRFREDIKVTKDRVVTLKETTSKRPIVLLASGKTVRADLLVIAAGFWCNTLLPDVFAVQQITGKMGVSFRVRTSLKNPFIFTWAPYKQVVAHQQSKNEVWIGDGSAISPKSWDTERVVDCRIRCAKVLEVKQSLFYRRMVGIRPYFPNGHFLFQKLGKCTYVVTGTGKQGTIVSGYAAHKISSTEFGIR